MTAEKPPHARWDLVNVAVATVTIEIGPLKAIEASQKAKRSTLVCEEPYKCPRNITQT